MVFDDRSRSLEPEFRDLGQDPSFIRDAGPEHVVEGGDPVAGDEQQIFAKIVDVADFAPSIRSPAGQRGVENRRGEGHTILTGEKRRILQGGGGA